MAHRDDFHIENESSNSEVSTFDVIFYREKYTYDVFYSLLAAIEDNYELNRTIMRADR